jgi:hypothetical protein
LECGIPRPMHVVPKYLASMPPSSCPSLLPLGAVCNVTIRKDEINNFNNKAETGRHLRSCVSSLPAYRIFY